MQSGGIQIGIKSSAPINSSVCSHEFEDFTMADSQLPHSTTEYEHLKRNKNGTVFISDGLFYYNRRQGTVFPM